MLVRSITALLSLALLTGAALAQAPQGFQLTAIEQAFLDQVLTKWEQESGKIETFNCDFTQFEYDPVFGPGNDEVGQPIAKSEGYGAVSYQKPDKGSFHVKELLTWDAAQKKRVANSNLVGAHWVCDGASVYEFRNKEKVLHVTPIPPEMQGQNITDGPLPFLFGAKADTLKQRYWLRVDPRAPEGSIWLAAMPKRQQDAANYRLVELMLDSSKMLHSAMRVTAPDSSQTTYTFKLAEASINSRVTAFWNTLFQAPRTPIGWTKVVEPPQMAPAPAQAQAPAPVERR
jgi:TIGR03009 family protein